MTASGINLSYITVQQMAAKVKPLGVARDEKRDVDNTRANLVRLKITIYNWCDAAPVPF